MTPPDVIAQLVAEFRQIGRSIMERVERRLASVSRGDVSSWFYIEAVAADTVDGRKQATVKVRDAPVGAGNPALGPLPCLRSYTPVVGQRVLVRWIAGDRADGVIEG